MNKYIFSNKYKKYIERSEEPEVVFNILEGSVRRGKTVANVVAFCRAIEKSEAELHLIAGFTSNNAVLNILECNGYGVLDYFEGRCKLKKKAGKTTVLEVVTLKGEKKNIYILGGGKSNSKDLIQGATLGCVFITEVNLCNEEFVKCVEERTYSVRNRKIFYDLNPRSPNNFIYKQYIDKYMKDKELSKYINYEHCTLVDNKALSRERIIDILKSYRNDQESIFYKRNILGLRVSADGVIYTGFRRDKHVEEGIYRRLGEKIAKREYIRLTAGIDIGRRDATVMTLIGIKEGFKGIEVIDGYYYKSKEEEIRGVNDYCNDIVERLEEWSKYGYIEVYIDNADPMFIDSLYNVLNMRYMRNRVELHGSRKLTIQTRIKLFNDLINNNMFKIDKRLEEWIDAIENGVWDNKKSEASGKDVRLDNGTFSVDCLDSMEYGVTQYMEEIIENIVVENNKRVVPEYDISNQN